MKSLSAKLIAHYALGTTTIAKFCKVTRTDGEVFAATSLDQALEIDGVTYLPTSSFVAKDQLSSMELNPDTSEIEGFLGAPGITDDDIHSGVWDYATVEVFEANYNDLSMGINPLPGGTLGEVKAGRSKFSVELRGLMQAYMATVGRITTKECTADLGDARCKVNLATYTVTGTIDSSTGNRTIVDAARTEAAGWFVGARFTFTSGLNDGLSMEVKSSIPGQIILQQAMPFDIAEDDTYSTHRGCQKREFEDCRDKFNNIINFRGFGNVPGASIYKRGGV